MAEIPIVCLMSTYREGKLPRGAIKSALKATPHIIVFEGLTESEHVPGPETDLGNLTKYIARKGKWNDEADKRNEMLNYAQMKFPKPTGFWILLLDGDELLVWGEYLRDWLDQLDPGYGSAENVVPIKVTEPSRRQMQIPLPSGIVEVPGELWTDTGPSHLYHSSIIKRYVVGAWQIETPSGLVAMLDRMESPNPPAMGEPHIHHRSYLRRGERKDFRANQLDERRWIDARDMKKQSNVPETTLLEFSGEGMNRYQEVE